jgi:hypothetical protein
MKPIFWRPHKAILAIAAAETAPLPNQFVTTALSADTAFAGRRDRSSVFILPSALRNAHAAQTRGGD